MGEEKKRGPKPRVSDEEILQTFRQSPDPVLTASEVAAELPIKRRSVYDRLSQLKRQKLSNLRRLADGRQYGGSLVTPQLLIKFSYFL